MFKIMKEKAPIYLKKIDSNKSIREDKDKPCNNIPLSNRLFQTFFFSFCFKQLVQIICYHKKLWVDCNVQE